MRAVTILRPDITSEELADTLSVALGLDYRVARSGADAVLVQAGSKRAARAQVRIDSGPDRTVLTVHPGGLVFGRLNSFDVARRIRRVLQQSAELRMPG